MNRTGRWRVIGAGVLWAVVYNLLWGTAWIAFMRREWLAAMAAWGRQEALSLRSITTGSTVNLIALVAVSLAGARLCQRARQG